MNDGNEILEELWKSRKEIEKENNNSIDKIYEKYLQKQKQHPSDYYVGKPVPTSKSKAA
jgi:hypothetical protein